MALEQYDIVKRDLQCKYACLLACGCDLLFQAADLLATLPRVDRDLLYYELCSTGCAVEIGGGGGAPPPGDGGGTLAHQCTQRLVDAVCTANRKVQLTLLRTYIAAVKALMGGDSTGMLDKYIDLIDALLGWCNNPTGGNVDQFVTRVCNQWSAIRGTIAQLRTALGSLGPPGTAAQGVLDGLLNPQGPLAQALDSCCGVVSSSPVRPGPGEVVAVRNPSSGSQVVTRPVGSVPLQARYVRVPRMPAR